MYADVKEKLSQESQAIEKEMGELTNEYSAHKARMDEIANTLFFLQGKSEAYKVALAILDSNQESAEDCAGPDDEGPDDESEESQ